MSREKKNACERTRKGEEAASMTADKAKAKMAMEYGVREEDGEEEGGES